MVECVAYADDFLILVSVTTLLKANLRRPTLEVEQSKFKIPEYSDIPGSDNRGMYVLVLALDRTQGGFN